MNGKNHTVKLENNQRYRVLWNKIVLMYTINGRNIYRLPCMLLNTIEPLHNINIENTYKA